ncbi:MAG: hypothetical protein WC230_01870, partial [Bacteroidales bacterium]
HKFTIDLATWTKSDSTSATNAEIQNRLDDMVDNLIVIGDIGEGRSYTKQKPEEPSKYGMPTWVRER